VEYAIKNRLAHLKPESQKLKYSLSIKSNRYKQCGITIHEHLVHVKPIQSQRLTDEPKMPGCLRCSLHTT